MKTLVFTIALLAAAMWPADVRAGPAHQHGVARLDVVLDGLRLTVALDTPLDNVLGFERAPRTDAERRAADQALALLRSADRVMRIDPAARCAPGSVTVESPVLGSATRPPERGEPVGHADLQAEWQFNCQTSPASLEVLLFDVFKGFQRLEVQLVGPTWQRKAVLRRGSRTLSLQR